MDIRFVKIKNLDPVAQYLAGVINRQLAAGKRVLWLVPGGTAVPVAVAVAKLVRPGRDRLVVTLTDERYGADGHPDSNWAKLAQAGFALAGAQLDPVLSGQGMEATVNRFGALLERELTQADYRLGFFGLGPDGHTAGILPHSPACRAQGFAAGYNAADFRRITMTVPAIRRLDEAVVYATGQAKHWVLDELEQPHELVEQPAQALRSVSKLLVFNDYKGEEL